MTAASSFSSAAGAYISLAGPTTSFRVSGIDTLRLVGFLMVAPPSLTRYYVLLDVLLVLKLALVAF